MVKCKNCNHEIEGVKHPMVCPKCGHIMKPHTKKKSKKEKTGEDEVEKTELDYLSE